MKTKTIIIIFLVLLSVKAMAQGFDWVKKYQPDLTGELRCVIVTGDKQYMACGKTNKAGYLMKADTSGTLVWDKSFLYLSEIFQLRQTSDGGFAFYAVDSSTTGSLFAKTDANCDTLWTVRIAGSLPRTNKSFQQTADNGYILVFSKSDTLHLRKLSVDGSFLWEKKFTGLHKASGNTVCQTSDGGYLVGGNTNDSLPGNAKQDMYIFKTDAYGDTLWTYIIPMTGFQELMDAVETDDNNFALLYYSGNGCKKSPYIRKINAADTVLWDSSIMTDSYSAFPWSLCKTTAHGFMVAGEMQHTLEGTTWDFTVSKIDSLGIEKWVLNYNGPDYDYAYSAVQESDSVFIASGYSCNGGIDNKLTMAKISSVLNPAAIQDFPESMLFSMYPNPSDGNITLLFPASTKQIRILTSIGEIVQSISLSRKTMYNISLMETGLYFIQIITDKQTTTKKLIIIH